jgi:hypothetical protein
MAVMPKLLSLLIAAGVLATGSAGSSASDPPEVQAVSLHVKPLIATSSAGRTLFLQVRCEGAGAVGKKIPLSVVGAPEGTTLEVLPMTEQDAVVGLAFPASAARGHYLVSLRVGGPEPVVAQEIAIEIGE